MTQFDSCLRPRCAVSEDTVNTLEMRAFTSDLLLNHAECTKDHRIHTVEIGDYELDTFQSLLLHRKCQFLHRIGDEFRRLPVCWLRQKTCHRDKRLSEKTYQKYAMDRVIGPGPYGPDTDVGLHRREQLLHTVLVAVHLTDYIRIVVQVGC